MDKTVKKLFADLKLPLFQWCINNSALPPPPPLPPLQQCWSAPKKILGSHPNFKVWCLSAAFQIKRLGPPSRDTPKWSVTCPCKIDKSNASIYYSSTSCLLSTLSPISSAASLIKSLSCSVKVAGKVNTRELLSSLNSLQCKQQQTNKGKRNEKKKKKKKEEKWKIGTYKGTRA